MAEPVDFTIRRDAELWRLLRDGREIGVYSHVDQATHDAVNHARALQESGSPAAVGVMLEQGGRLEIDVAPEPPNPDLESDGEAFTRSTPL